MHVELFMNLSNLHTPQSIGNYHTSNEHEKNNNSNEQSSSIESVLDILDIKLYGDDFEELQLTRRMRKKKKRGRRI